MMNSVAATSSLSTVSRRYSSSATFQCLPFTTNCRRCRYDVSYSINESINNRRMESQTSKQTIFGSRHRSFGRVAFASSSPKYRTTSTGTTITRLHQQQIRNFGHNEDRKHQMYRISEIVPTDEAIDGDTTTMKKKKKALVVGTSGALGSCIARDLATHGNMDVLGADVVSQTYDCGLHSFCNLSVSTGANNPHHTDLKTMTTTLTQHVQKFLFDDENQASTNEQLPYGLDVIICVSGGFQPDPNEITPKVVGQIRLNESEVLDSIDGFTERCVVNYNVNVHPALAATFVAQHYCSTTVRPAGFNSKITGTLSTPTSLGPMMVVLGASSALQATPGMLGYGCAKSTVHHIIKTLGACTSSTLESKSVRKAGRRVRTNLPSLDSLRVIGLLTSTIDTPANRKFLIKPGMKNVDSLTSTWTKPQDISNQILEWITVPDDTLRPHSGSMFRVQSNKKEAATFELIH